MNLSRDFFTFNDFLEFFVDNFDGDITPFERTLKEIDLFYSMSNGECDNDNIRVVHKDEKLCMVLKKMLKYRVGMIPVVQDMESKKQLTFSF